MTLAEPKKATTALPHIQRRTRRITDPLLFLVALTAAVATLVVLLGFGVAVTERRIVVMLAIDSILALILACLVAWRLWGLYRARSTGKAGARLHLRMVSLVGVA
ncbi:MAG: hypothetical protein LCH61_14575, partial [Proteobacteria bacterium]|nr:hypothetical protein [Pseudomonadota bacterium]